MRSAATSTKAGPRALALELTKGCNLRCGYCYYAAREDAYDPRTSMAPEVAERSVDLVLEDGPPDETAHLHFFGGEPLLNVPLLRHVLAYAAARSEALGRAITFEVTTNGTRFTDETIALLNAHAVHVGVSFDGPKEVQDRARPALGGSSYDAAVPGIRRFLASRAGTPLAARTHCSVVVTRAALDLVGIVRHLEELGFAKIILTPATDPDGKGDGLRPEDLPRFLEALDALARDDEERRRRGAPVSATWFERLLGRVLSGERKLAPCQGGVDYLGVQADGKVSLCYRFFEDEEGSMGDVARGIDRTLTERLRRTGVDARAGCSTCWARYFCGGGCHHDNLMATGDLADPNPVACEILRHSMDRTLEMWARLSGEGVLPRRAPIAVAAGGLRSTTMSERPRAKDTCHVRRVGAEEVVYEPTTHEIVVLNATAALLFHHCDGTRTASDLADLLAARFAAPREVLEKDVASALALFREKGLIA